MKPIRAAVGAMSLIVGTIPFAAQAQPTTEVRALAQDVQRAESVRAVKTLQRTYAQYAQYGLWREAAGLFSPAGTFTVDDKVIRGRDAIESMLVERYGDGRYGLPAGSVHTLFIETPMLNLSADGRTAKSRWHFLAFLGEKAKARIEGGIFENDYALSGGVWRITAAHYYPQYAGPYKDGWVNWGGGDLPLVPYHFKPDEVGVAIPPPASPAPETKASLSALEQRIAAMVDENEIRNLQSAYGYYKDRKMWDDVVDLFAPAGVLEIGGVGVYKGPAGVRKALERDGSAGLKHGQLYDHPQFDTVVTVAPGGREAFARGIELGMLGEADQGRASWDIRVFNARYVKDGGRWKIREMRAFPLLRADYHQGWGEGRLAEPPPPPGLEPDSPEPATDAGAPGSVMPAFLAPDPVSGKTVAPPSGVKLAASSPLTPPIIASSRAAVGSPEARLAEARRGLARATAYDGIENVATAYDDYLDDFQSPLMGGLFAQHGFKVSAFAGYYIGPERITRAGLMVWGTPPTTRPGSFHWRIQPVINIAADGRSANVQERLFQPRTSKEPSKPNAFYGAGFHGGMYHDQYVLEAGQWRMWNLSLDEPYFFSVDWKGGWSAAKDPTEAAKPRPSPLLSSNFLPDVPITGLGEREEHFRGGTGQSIEWPGILPMWFDYRNPVSGRTPPHFWPDCVPCVAHPELRMTNYGYLQPPNGPTADQ